LLGAASLVLIIASVNVAAMLSSKALARRREMAVRAALGATRLRLVRQLLTEILILFALGAAGGLALAYLGTSALERMPIPAEITFAPHLSPDARVFAFALAISLLTGLIVGLVPARRATHTDVATQLRDGAAAASARRTWLGNALVVSQLSASLVLLVGVGLFLRALQHASRMNPGFDAAGVATAQFDAGSWGYDEAKGRVFFRALRDRVEALPGVTAVSYAALLPLTLRSNVDEMEVEGDTKVPIHFLQVDDQYMAVLRIAVVAGRNLARTDDERAPKAAIVNESFARRFAAGRSVLGRTFRYRDKLVTIVGVTRDAKLESIAEIIPPRVYFPLAQQWENHRSLMVRTSGDPRALASAIQAAVHELDPTAPRPAVVPLTRSMSIGLMPQRIAATVTGVLGGVGLILATIGLYGIIAYSTSRRAREIGIRLALGARRADILTMVLRDGVQLVALGVGLGLLIAAGASRVLTNLLFGVSPFDVAAFAGMSALFVAVALVASWLPARRAANSSPMVVMRAE
jgi:predicted permease